MQGTPIERTLVTAGDHIDWITTSPDAMRFTLSLKSFQNARNCPALFASMSVLIVRSSSAFVMLPLSRYLWAPSDSTTIAASMMPIEEHTSELQSHSDLVCRLLLEKKKKK